MKTKRKLIHDICRFVVKQAWSTTYSQTNEGEVKMYTHIGMQFVTKYYLCDLDISNLINKTPHR